MREIKFRIYNKKSMKWIHGPGHEVNLFGEVILMGYLLDKIPVAEINDCVALQYTGFKDKNGNEIYEGDFLSVEDEIFLIVEWNKDLGQFQQRNPQSGEQYDLSVYGDCCVVVGNIFEPPCNPDHNGECLVCDCWLSECPFRK
jgi:YopX protein